MHLPVLVAPRRLSPEVSLVSAELWSDEVVLHIVVESDDASSPEEVDRWGPELAILLHEAGVQLIETVRSVGKMGERFRIDSYYRRTSPTSSTSFQLSIGRAEAHCDLELTFQNT